MRQYFSHNIERFIYITAWMIDKISLYEHLKEGYLKEIEHSSH
jgi:hypothetical protein